MGKGVQVLKADLGLEYTAEVSRDGGLIRTNEFLPARRRSSESRFVCFVLGDQANTREAPR